jgi:uncharacterized protein (DUF1697 family)
VSAQRHIALLRGINVGGSRIIRMADLRDCFVAMGFADVATYIQSGNVVFSAKDAGDARLAAKIEKALAARFDYDSRVVVLGAADLGRVVAEAPHGFGKDGGRYRYDVLFVRRPLTAEEALEQVPAKPGVDQVHAGTLALYFRRLIARAVQSRLSRLVQRPIYQSITIRNWNTTTRLLELAGG